MIRGYSGLGAVLDQAEEVPAPTTAASPAPEPPQQAAPAAAPPPADEPRLNRTGRTMTIVVPVKDGPRMLGDVDAQITPDDALLLSVEGLATLLSRQLSTDKLAELRSTPTQDGFAPQIGRAHVCTPVTNAHHVCRLLLEKKK